MIRVYTDVSCFDFDMSFEEFSKKLGTALSRSASLGKTFLACEKRLVAVRLSSIVGFEEIKEDSNG